LISNTELKAENENSKDLFGRVYEYFLGEFANAEGKKGGNRGVHLLKMSLRYSKPQILS
jgi:hypothetical protein